MARRKERTFEEVFTEAGLIPEWMERGRVQGLEQGRQEEKQNIISLLKSGKSAEEILQLMENGIAEVAT